MSPVHVLVDHGHWHDEIDVIVIDHVDQETQCHDEASVLEVCQLYVHGSELDAPSNA